MARTLSITCANTAATKFSEPLKNYAMRWSRLLITSNIYTLIYINTAVVVICLVPCSDLNSFVQFQRGIELMTWPDVVGKVKLFPNEFHCQFRLLYLICFLISFTQFSIVFKVYSFKAMSQVGHVTKSVLGSILFLSTFKIKS